MINKELLEILACPKCKTGVTLSGDGSSLICDNCKLAYHVSDDIPVMLIDGAKPINKE